MSVTYGNDFISNDNLPMVWKEINMIEQAMHVPEDSGAAAGLKSGKGFLADGFMANIMFPTISSLKEFVQHTGKYSLLINYYGDNDYYLAHTDDCEKTLTIVLSKEEDAFTGGDFKFEDLNLVLPFKNNSYVMFDSTVKHEVTPVKLKGSTGRYSLNYFFY